MDVLTRVLKIALATLLAVVVVIVGLLAALAVVAKYTDWSEHKDLLIAAVERFTDWQVEQLGDIEIDLFFPTEIRVDNVRLTQTSEESAVSSVSAEQFQVRFEPLSPFFDERLIIQDIQTSGARVVARSTSTDAPEQTGPPSIPFVGSAEVSDTEVLYQTGGGGQPMRLRIASLEMQSEGQGEGSAIAGHGTLEGLDFSIDGTTGPLENLSAQGDPLPVDLEMVLAGDRIAVDGQLAMEEGDISFDMSVTAEGDNLAGIAEPFGVALADVPPYAASFTARKSASQIALESLQLQLGETEITGQASVQLDGDKPYLQAELEAPRVRRQDLLSLVPQEPPQQVADAGGSEPVTLDFLNLLNADVRLSVDEYQGAALEPIVSGATLEVTLEDGRLTASGEAEAGDLRVAFTAGMGPPPDSDAQSPAIPFELDANAAGDRVVVEGQLITGGGSLEVELDAATRGDSLGEITQAFGIPLASVPAYQGRLSAHASGDEMAVESFQFTLGQSSVSGQAELQVAEPRPQLRVAMQAPLIREQDILSLLPQSTDAQPRQTADQSPQGEQTQAEAQPPGSASEILDFLTLVDADITASVAEYQGQTLGPLVNEADFRARLGNGRLRVSGQVDADEMQIDLYGTLGRRGRESDQPGPVPFSLEVSAGDDIFATEGQVVASESGLAVDADAAMRGDSLVQIASVFGFPLGEVPPYKGTLSARATPEGASLEDIQLTLGHTNLYGTASLQLGEDRPYLRADMGASLIRREDIDGLIPETPQEEPDEPLTLDFLNSLDADVELAVAEYQGETLGLVISGAVLEASLDNGRLNFSGQVTAEDLEVSYTGALGPPPAEQATGPVPFNLEVGAAGDTLTVDGQARLGPDNPSVEVQGSIEGDSLEQIAGAFGMRLEGVPPYTGEFSGTASSSQARLEDFQLTLGYSHVYGQASLQIENPRPYISANLNSSRLRQDDLASLIPASDAEDGGDAEAENVEGGEEESGRIFSSDPLPLDLLHQFDADVDIAIAEFEGDLFGPLLNGMALQANLEDGRLSIDPLELGLAGGTVEGTFLLDDQANPAQLQVDMSADNVGLEPLFATLVPATQEEEEGDVARGDLTASLQLESVGASPRKWVEELDGEFSFAVGDGAMPAFILEAIGLDLMETLTSWIGDNPLAEIECAIGRFDIYSGLVATDVLFISTTDSNLIGEGEINLEQETIDYTVEAAAKDFSVFASDSPLHITGSLDDIQFSLASGELAARVGAAAALALVNPLLAAAPFVELGTGETGRCGEVRQELQRIQEKGDVSGAGDQPRQGHLSAR